MEDKIADLKSFVYPSRHDQYPRLGHRCLHVGHHILLFGGINSQGELNPHLLRINCQDVVIDTIFTKNSLLLQGFSLFSYKGKIYLWGGANSSEPRNDLWEYIGDEYVLIPQKGSIPAGRHFHASTMLSNRYLLIFGGVGANQIFKDWYIFDCKNLQWSKIETDGEVDWNLNPQLIWNGGRGFLLISELFKPISRRVCYLNTIYQIKFTDFTRNKIRVTLVNVTKNTSLDSPIFTSRGNPSTAFLNLDSPYLVMLGGQRMSETIIAIPNLYSDVWFFNLQTLQWTQSKLKINFSFGFETIVYQERLYLVGGVSVTRQLNTTLEIIQLNYDSIETKLCQTCRQIYGLKQGDGRLLNIKFQYEQSPKSFYNGQIITKFAKSMQNPITAFGLFLDNSINLGATSINIQFKTFQKKLLDQTDGYDYIQITDNSNGLHRDQILESVYSFSIKTETLTSDHKYQEELTIMKEYGLNLKLGALRLGRCCLFTTKTLEGQLFVTFFTSHPVQCNGSTFGIFHYFMTNEKDVSSQINRNIIKYNTINCIPQQYEQFGHFSTRIYIFHLYKQEISKKREGRGIYSPIFNSKIFRDLKSYGQSLYLNPYIGREITIDGQRLKFIDYQQQLRKGQQEGKLTRIDLKAVESMFQRIFIYSIVAETYFLEELLIYHQNRLITSIAVPNKKICGILQIPSVIQADITKTRIQRYFQEKRLKDFIMKIFNSKFKHQISRQNGPSKRVKAV